MPDKLRSCAQRALAALWDTMGRTRSRASVDAWDIELQLSRDARQVAQYLSRISAHGLDDEPDDELVADIVDRVRLRLSNIWDAIRILERLGLAELRDECLLPKRRLFAETDRLFTAHDPAVDARVLAREVVDASGSEILLAELAAVLEWTPRRMNPAAAYLLDRGFVRIGECRYAPTWLVGSVVETRDTAAFFGGPAKRPEWLQPFRTWVERMRESV